jgi:predicted nucleic acid-binding protein
MMLVDAGPLVALVDVSDRHHRRCVTALRGLTEPLATVWPVVAEAMTRLRGIPRGQDAILEMIERSVAILELSLEDVPRMRELRRKHSKARMGLGEMGLLRVAERDGIDRVFTLERSRFRAYRIDGRKRFRITPLA